MSDIGTCHGSYIHVKKASFDYSSKYFHPRKHSVYCHIWEHFLGVEFDPIAKHMTDSL